MRTRARLATATFAAVFLVSAAAPAAPAPPPKAGAAPAPKKLADRLTGEARKHFESAMILYEDQNYEGALAEFTLAYDLSKEPRVLRNIAVCHKNLKHYADAITALERELVEATDLEPDVAAQIKEDLETLKPLTGVGTFTISEAGAEISVDGRVIGTTPFAKAIRVEVGEHVVTAKKAGFLDATQKVTVSGGSTFTVTITMEPSNKTGHLEVNGPAGSKVSVDGAPVGVTPWKGDLPAGKHVVEVSAPGFVAQKNQIVVEWNKTATYEPKLEKEKHEGLLAIDTGDDATTISLDGKIVGKGSFRGSVASGGHQLAVSRSGYKTYQTEVTVLDGQQRVVTIQLEEDKSTWMWWLGGGVAVVGLGVGGYFLFKPKDEQPIPGTLSPGVVTLPFGR